ncbi:MAG TPA: DUF2147 domain-containing protein [Thermohalobaculum sp.]|nr:DUF2147 domain-containing protein [Thermohalobaculum sp.]
MLGMANSLVARLGGMVLLAGALGMFAALSGAASAITAERSALFGPWLSQKEKLIVEFYPCGSEVCGRIAWMAKPYRNGALRRDNQNPDPALRDRPFCGIEVIRGLAPDGDGSWTGGKVYDPKRGATYSLEVRQKSADRLELRAFLGVKFLGKTEVWTRPDPDHEIACVPVS